MAVSQVVPIEGNEKGSSKAVMTRELKLNTLQAQKVLRRSYSRLGEAVFSSGVVLRARCTQEEADTIDELIEEHFSSVEEELDKAFAQTDVLMEQHGVEDAPDYTNRMVFQVEVKAPLALRFLTMIARLDNLIGRFDTLWLHSALTSGQRSNWTFQWQQRLIRMSSRVIGIEKSARIKADKKYQEDQQIRKEQEEAKAAKKAKPASDDATADSVESPGSSEGNAATESVNNSETPDEKSDAPEKAKPKTAAKKATKKDEAAESGTATDEEPAQEEPLAKVAQA